MTYYHLPTDTERQPRRTGEAKLSDGFIITPPEGGWTDDLAALCGFVPVVDTPRPADTATTTHDRSIELVDGVPTVVWTERAKTQAELDAESAEAERSTADTRLRQSYNALRQWSTDAATVAAQGTNVTQAQHKALFDRFGKLCDGMADLLVSLAKRG